ncbi:unnamed protein product [Cladocopium goreaui]|uniref:LINE-1 retrotransposable element ORF2 protein (ORF2p) n=1 Tax=Cladocopium goreaui TaxID=2562237 RepID=A0A9P1FXJ8_9DINO|nr:unnamed protein product [Cladocopium goreaui]
MQGQNSDEDHICYYMARKRRLERVYQVAGEASQARDHFRLYQAIRQLAPKQQFCRLQIRSSDGNIMTPGQEADLLAQWFTELYQDTESPPALPFNWPFTSSEFCEGLRSLPLRKALAPEYVPSPFWKLTAQQVSTYLDPALHEWSSNARFPQCWSDGTLVFLPKTKKRTQTPSELRPISLLEPCGKSVMGMCASQILAHTWQELQRWPQFAYLPARGVDEALHRILQHCRRVRDLIDTYQFRVHMQAQGLERLHLCGGLTISLDLTKAFDMVNRCQLLEGLNQFNIPCDLIELLKAIYQHTAFQFQHKGESRSFETRRGIRQGCRAAPTLWAVFSVMMLRAIAHRISFDWVLACVTLFADDGTFHQVLESEADFHRAIKFIGIALDTIESFNMKVNVSKTVAVLRMVGPLTKNPVHLTHLSRVAFLRAYGAEDPLLLLSELNSATEQRDSQKRHCLDPHDVILLTPAKDFAVQSSLIWEVWHRRGSSREEDLEQVEHRLRIQELLQVARSHQLQALANNAQLLAYFYTRCALCNTFCTTTTGLLQHWKMEHDREFRQHEPFNTALLQACIETNPCQFCGACFKRTHRCHIIRQVALLMVQHGIDMQVSEDATSLTCPYCQKVYTTRHGLQSHVNVYHMAEQACEHFKPEEVEMYCLVHQAVQTEEAEDLLGNPSIQHFLANTLSFERQQMPQVVALPPDQLLSPEDYIEPLTRLGHVQALYKMSHLKYQLSTICQVCGLACENAEALRLHLHAAHSDHLQEVQTLRELLVWTLFGDLGCFCNPSHGWGTAAHECTGLIQLALVIHELRMQIVVPWAFNSTDVVHLLSDMMPLPSVQRVGLALMSRQFYWIWQDPILLRTLATRCLLCQEAVDLQCIHAHLRVFHQVEPERVWYMVQQLCQVYANLMMEGAHCEWCRELMPSYFTDDELQYDPEEHLKSCPMMTQMALLLMMPRWSKPMLPLHTWPRQEDIAENHRLLELRIWQHNADPSDTYGMSLDIIAKSGLDFAQDAWIADGLMYRVSDAMEDQDSMVKIWGNLLTEAQLKGLGITESNQQTSNKRHKGDKADNKGRSKPASKPASEMMSVPKDLMINMAKLVLKHEDTLNTLLQESEFVLHLAPGEGSLLPLLLMKSQEWHKGPKTIPLRHTLAVSMMMVLEERLTKLANADTASDLFQACIQQNLITKEKTMPYLRWDASQSRLTPSNAPHLPLEQVQRSLTNILRLMGDKEVTLRYHALKRTPDSSPSSQPIPWLWTVSMRHTPELWNEIANLCYHSIWRLILANLKPQSLQRQPLAQQLGKMLQK